MYQVDYESILNDWLGEFDFGSEFSLNAKVIRNQRMKMQADTESSARSKLTALSV